MGTVTTAPALTDRASWLQARRAGVGASEVAAILGVDPRRGPLAVYAAKVAAQQDDDIESEDDPRYWGRGFEEPVAQWYAQKTGRTVTNPGAFAIRQHPKVPILFATPDRDVVDEQRGKGKLECKAVSVWGPLDLWRVEAPLVYQIQLQVQLAVDEEAWGSIAAVLGGAKPVFHDHERNERFIAAMLRSVEQFWERVERRDPPPPDGTSETHHALKQLYPEDSGRVMVFPSDRLGLIDEWRAAKEAVSAAEDKVEAAEVQIKALMQDATWAALPEGRRLQWKTEPRKGHVVEASRPRVLRLLKK
jgi:putative phage-type endonuclease